MQVFSVQIWLLSGLVISYAHPEKQHGETTVTSEGSSNGGDHTAIADSLNVRAIDKSDANPITDANSLRNENTNNFPPDSKWPIQQNAAAFSAFLNQPVKNASKPGVLAQLGPAVPPSSDTQALQGVFAYKPGHPNVVQHLLSSVQGSNHSVSNFFAKPSSAATASEITAQTNNTAMNDPIPNPLSGIINSSQATVSNATSAAQEITGLWGTNVQNGIFGSANLLTNRPSNDPAASGSTDSPGSSNPIQGIISASQTSLSNATGTVQNLAGQFGPNVQNGLSNLFGLNINRPSNDEPVRPVRPSSDEPVTQSTEANSTTEAATSSTASSEATTSAAPDTTSSTDATTTESPTTTTTVTTTTSGTFLPLVSFVNNSQSLINSSTLIQTVTSQLTSNLPNGLNFFIPRPSKTKVADEQEIPELDDDNRAAGTLKAVPPPPAPSCPICTSSCFYRPFQRIVGGSDVPSSSTYPFIVLITYLDSPSGQGSLINDRAVLTTATVIKSMPVKMHIRALLGVYNRANTMEPVTSKKIKTIYIHPGFRQSNQYANNIGLLILKQPLSQNFYPICLPVTRTESPPVSKATIIGWGAANAGGTLANILQEVELQMYAPLICSLTSRQATLNNLCGGRTEFISNAGATCTGDGGDPLVAFSGNSWELFGIALDIPQLDCGNNRAPAMFTAIIPYLDWITTYGVGCECFAG